MDCPVRDCILVVQVMFNMAGYATQIPSGDLSIHMPPYEILKQDNLHISCFSNISPDGVSR
jgi:hypothetical protein